MPRPRKQILAVAAALAAVAGCGGDGGDEGLQRVDGSGYSFSAPAGWEVVRRGRTVEAANGTEVVSVTVFRLARPYRPALWDQAVSELDHASRRLAQQLDGRLESLETTVVAGRRARRYEISYEREGRGFLELGAFLLDGQREYQLVCRFERTHADETEPCRTLFSSLRLSGLA